MAIFDEDSLLQGADTAIQDRLASAMAANTTQPTEQTLAATGPVVTAPIATPEATTPAPSGNANRLLSMLFSLTSGPGADKTLKQAATQLFDLSPPQLQGPDVISKISGGAPSRGGILGTGIEPVDVLALAIGGLITSRMPQAQALQTTMQIAQLPSQFKANQRKSATEFIDTVMKASQLENVNLETQRKQLELKRKDKFFSLIQPGQTTLTPEQKFAGVAAGVLPASILEQKTQVVEVGGSKRLIDMTTGNVVADLGVDKTAKLSESGFAQLSDPAQEYILQQATRRGVDLPTIMTDSKVVDEAIQLSKAERDAAAARAQQRITVQLAQQGFTNASTLRQQYLSLPTIKDFQFAQNGFSRIQELSKQPPSALRDVALIYNFQAVSDPGSVTRDAEFKTIGEARAWLERTQKEGRIVPSAIVSAIQRATPDMRGSFLTPTQAGDFLTTATSQFNGLQRTAEGLRKTFQDLAVQSGLPAESIPNFNIVGQSSTQKADYEYVNGKLQKVKK